MAKGKSKSIVSPWLGASKNITVAGKTSVGNMGSNESQIDTGGGERDKVNETLMLGIAGAAGVTAATLGARAIQSGKAAVKGTYFGVHGSETQNLFSIAPSVNRTKNVTNVTNNAARAAGYNVPDVPVVYSYPAQANRVAGNIETAGAYAKQGSVYVVRTPQTNVRVAQWNPIERYSSQPLKVVKEIKVPQLPKDAPVYATKEVKQFALANINAARAVRDADMIKQVQNAVRNQKVKTFLQGAIKRR